jgi:excinuclease ABC subunit A
MLWEGTAFFAGINHFFTYLEEKAYKIQYRVILSRYRGKTTCPDCRGTRLRKDANYVKIGSQTITDMVLSPITQLRVFFDHLQLDKHREKIARRLLIEIRNRLSYLDEVGLGYLTLNRLSNTLSGGESQRINLATSLGSSLVGSMYILDEPSIGLHPRDTSRLIGVLRSLQKLGNTVIVVEHDEEIMKAADHIIDLGPLAGSHGGKIVFEGTFDELPKTGESLTAQYLKGGMEVSVPKVRRKWKDKIELKGVRQHNLKNIDVEIPLHVLTAITGVSGSGKSTLVSDVLFPALRKQLLQFSDRLAQFDTISGDIKSIKAIEFVDQNPIGKSSRSNPVTYVKAFDEIRTLYSELQLAKARLYKPSHFSFNVSGGRCDHCEGEGEVTIEMQFMADIKLLCEVCKGKRFKDEVLEVEYRGKSIYDVLELTVEDAIDFFEKDQKVNAVRKLVEKLAPLKEVGLGYVKLGQSSSTLSGGEAQRIKLASFLSKGGKQEHTLFIFDEPTTGLHFHDVNKLLDAFNALINKGHSILVIEHDMDVIKCADWVIDLGPEGGEEGGYVVAFGTPEQIARQENSYTGRYLKNKL